jgi:hypothetical protein
VTRDLGLYGLIRRTGPHILTSLCRIRTRSLRHRTNLCVKPANITCCLFISNSKFNSFVVEQLNKLTYSSCADLEEVGVGGVAHTPSPLEFPKLIRINSISYVICKCSHVLCLQNYVVLHQYRVQIFALPTVYLEKHGNSDVSMGFALWTLTRVSQRPTTF